jgi:uncharacterized metal-binding protein YceD (DUF177 family)
MQSLAALPQAGLDVTVEAKPQEREGIARYLDVASAERVQAHLTLKRWRNGGVRVTGQVSAQLTQTCVVTLEPFAAQISVMVDRKYLPAALLPPETQTQDEIVLDPDGEDPPEALPHDLDLGLVVLEELVLGIDPYPRKPGAAIPEADATDGDPPPQAPEPSPFASLQGLVPAPKKGLHPKRD